MQGTCKLALLRPRAQASTFQEPLLKVRIFYENCLRSYWFLREPYRVIPEFFLHPLQLAEIFPSLWLPAWAGEPSEMKGWSACASEWALSVLCWTSGHLDYLWLWIFWLEEGSLVKADPILRGSVEACPEESVEGVSGHCHDHQLPCLYRPRAWALWGQELNLSHHVSGAWRAVSTWWMFEY